MALKSLIPKDFAKNFLSSLFSNKKRQLAKRPDKTTNLKALKNNSLRGS